ncbi:hypothetical protein [Rothia mucilaginosa]|uniref:hypothetical protein n=1 Tax=Rothia mucilaginosa TaxID=43675 RepID=UPI0028D0C9B5|nr:hypothetical protein [Rothia mucilaginosa]
MAREGQTVSRHLKFETRQHKLGLDLGEGIPRKTLILGLIIFPLWWVMVFSILHGVNQITGMIYLLPPSMFLWFGTQESDGNLRRMRFTQGLLRVRYGLTNHRPVIRCGRREADPREFVPATVRFGQGLGSLVQKIVPRKKQDGTQEPVTMAPTLWLVGGDQLDAVGQREAARRAKKRKA